MVLSFKAVFVPGRLAGGFVRLLGVICFLMSSAQKGGAVKPLIVGLEGTQLGREEAACLKELQPFGVILFSRNIETLPQMQKLMADVKVQVPETLFCTDAEGGRVWRFPDSEAAGFGEKPRAAKFFGDMAQEEGLEQAQDACAQHFLDMGRRLKDWGFDVTLAPVLDLMVEGGHDIVGDRAFSSDVDHVCFLGSVAASSLRQAGVQVVLKHLPGHGAAKTDSHEGLPVIDLSEEDWAPHLEIFRSVISSENCAWGMTGHLKCLAFDDETPASFSKKIIKKIKKPAAEGGLGFGFGDEEIAQYMSPLLMTDDLAAMKGAFGIPEEIRCLEALNAGNDIALWCQGTLAAHQRGVFQNLPDMSQDVMELFRSTLT